MTPAQFELLALIASALCLLISIPMAVAVFQQNRKTRREAELKAIVDHALDTARVTTQTGAILAITEPFIEDHVSVSKFGDGRRLTAPIAEFLKPETGPIETLSFALKDPTEARP